MTKRPIFLSSILLAFIAMIVLGVSRERIMEGVKLKAKTIENAQRQGTKVAANPIASALSKEGQILDFVGLLLGLFSLVCLVIARFRRESGWYSMPLLLLWFALMELLLLV